MQQQFSVESFDIVIFGGCGDLALRKLMPALYRAFREGKLPADSRIFTTCRKQEEVSTYHDNAALALQQYLSPEEFSVDCWQQFKEYVKPVMLDILQLGEHWDQLKELLNEQKEKVRIYYLSVPPAVFGPCCKHLSKNKLITANSRLIVEKPLGYDAFSARAINEEIASYFQESSIYRVDHYLGKETVQNLLALRFSNLIFGELWNTKYIDHVQISLSETVGLEGRGGFYDDAGALRDMVQNHVLQLLCLIAMEPPNNLNTQSVQQEKIKVLRALRPLKGEDAIQNTVRGQYVAGSYHGELLPGYLEELESSESNTETFVALRVHVDNWRWARVPFYLRTGKRMKSRCAEIVIQFKEVAHQIIGETPQNLVANRLVIRLQPEESIQLTMMAKNMEVMDMQLQPATLNLNFSDTLQRFNSDAYKRLILDAAADNSSLFIHRDEVTSAWEWIDPIIHAWQEDTDAPHLYRVGTWGPDAADELVEADGRAWFNAGN